MRAPKKSFLSRSTSKKNRPVRSLLLGMLGLFASFAWSQTPGVTLSIQSPAPGSIFATASQTITGTIDPADAQLSLNHQAVTVQPDGSWSATVLLNPGLNTLRFQGEKTGHKSANRTLDLYWDQSLPEITIASPTSGVFLNSETVQVSGLVQDQYDSVLTVSRDGVPLTVVDGSFTDALTNLQIGENNVIYRVEDRSGNFQTTTLTVFYNNQPPVIDLQVPNDVQAETPFDIVVAAAPADTIASMELLLDGQVVYQADSGNVHTFPHSLSQGISQLSVNVRARDDFGNTSSKNQLVRVAKPKVVYGQVLLDDTGEPLANASVMMETPLGTTTYQSDGKGRYQGTVFGTPVTVKLDTPGFIPIQRQVLSQTDVWRVPDLRATALATPAPFAMTVSPTGFSGTPRVSFFNTQAIPALLPLGWSPVAGFSLDQASGSGSLAWLAPGAYLPPGVTLVLLKQQDNDWLVLDQRPSDAFSFLWNSAEAGAYLVAIPDTWATGTIPANGELLQRKSVVWVPPNTATEAQAEPARVSILDDPRTVLTHVVTSHGNVKAGSQARIYTEERHERFYQEPIWDQYSFDLYYYSYGHNDHQQAGRLAGSIPVRARQTVVASETDWATLNFRVDPSADPVIDTPQDLIWSLPGISVDFSGSFADQPSVDLYAVNATDLPLIPRSQLLKSFHFHTTGTLIQSPQIVLEDAPDDAMAVILLQQTAAGWIYRGRLTEQGSGWGNAAAGLDFLSSGTFALVSLLDPTVEIKGSITQNNQPYSGAVIRGDHFPWLGISQDTGQYRFVLPQLGEPQTVRAGSADHQYHGSRSLAATSGIGLLENQNMVLNSVGFSLLTHTPLNGAIHLSQLPKLSLTFNQAVSEDASNQAAGIQLRDTSGSLIPMQILPEPGRRVLHLVPKQALAASETHELTIHPSLQTWSGEMFDGPVSFSFTTRNPTITQSLELQKFYLAWDTVSQTMELVAPSDAYAAGTRLRVFVETSGFLLTTTLTNGEFRRPIEAVPGDRVALVADTPDGRTIRAWVSRVVRSDNSLTLGGPAQLIPLDSQTELRVDRISSGSQTRFQMGSLTIGEINQLLNDTSALADGPSHTALRGYRLEALGNADLPRFSGQFTATLDSSSWPNGFLQLVAIVPEIMAPADPSQPTQLTHHTFAFLMDVLPVLNGEIRGEGIIPAGSGATVPLRYDLGNASLPLTSKVHLALILTPSSAAKTTMKTAGDTPRMMRIKATRKNTEHVAVPEVIPAPWHGTLINEHPVPGSYIYQVLTVGGLPYFELKGVTGADGQASIYTYRDFGKTRGLDPATGELAYVNIGEPNSITGLDGLDILLSSVGKVTFDSSKYLIETGQSPPPSLSIQWEVGTNHDGVFQRDPARTATLDRLNKVQADASSLLRVTISSDQPIAASPAPSLTTSDGLTPEPLDLESSRVIFQLPAGSLSSDRLLSLTLEIANEGAQITTVTRDILVVDSAAPISKPGKPVLVTHLPTDGQIVPINETPYLAFSEPVTGVNGQTVKLLRDGNPVPVTYLDQNGFVVSAEDALTELYLVPQQSLRLESVFTLHISNLRDLELESLDVFQSTFETAEAQAEIKIHDEQVQALAGYRNLTLVAAHDWAGNDLQLHLYDIRNPDKPMDLLWSQTLDVPPAIRYRMALFMPEQLDREQDPKDATLLRDDARNRSALRNLPVGAVAALAYQRYGGTRNELRLLHFDGTQFVSSDPFPLLIVGWPETVAAVGRHLAVGFFQYGELGVTPVRGSTVVYDLPALMEDYPDLLERNRRRELTNLEFENALNNVGIVAKYPLPGDVRQITAFFRKAEDRYQPAMLISGATRPAIYPFDLDQQPVALGISVEAPNVPGDPFELDGVTPKYDGRMLAYTDYLNGLSISKMGNGAVEQLSYFDPRTQTLKASDFAIFSHHLDEGTLSIYELPQSLIPIHAPLEPSIRLTVLEGIAALAVDPTWGFIAVTTRDGRYTVFDLRALLEGLPNSQTGTYAVADALSHGSAMFPARPADMAWMQFQHGNLFSADHQGSLNRLPLAPEGFRETGWEVYDLADWFQSGTGSGSSPNLQAKLAEAVVLYATDLPMMENDTLNREFVVELGTFHVEIRDEADVQVQVHALVNGEPSGAPLIDIRRNGVIGPRLEPFSTHALAAYYADTTNQAFLREHLYEDFRLTYQVFEGNQLVARGTNDFAVVYRGPSTGDRDDLRTLGGIDALTLMPQFGAVDFELSAGDPRLGLFPSRFFSGDYVFQRGSFGMGMLSSQLLHMALPTWWRPERVGQNLPPAAAAVHRLMLEQPGHFHGEYEVKTDGTAQPLDDLQSSFTKQNGYWRFTHRDDMHYNFATSRALPRFYDFFQRANPNSQTEAEKLRFPLFRLQVGGQAPGQLYGEVPLRDQTHAVWNNRLRAHHDEKPTSRPSEIREFVNDAAKGTRRSDWAYQGSAAGPVIRKITLKPSGQEISYEHDAAGYLTEVRILGERPLTYTWENLGLTLGRLPIKRLKRIEQGNDFTQFNYAFQGDLRVSSVETPFGTKTFTTQRDLAGMVTSTAISALHDDPARTVTFSDAGGAWLSSNETLGAFSFDRTWERVTRDNRGRWLLATQEYRDQVFTYDDRGRLLAHEQGGGTQSWTYDPTNPVGLSNHPVSFTNSEGQTLNFRVTPTEIAVSADGAEQITRLSGSGIPYFQTGIDGLSTGAERTAYYQPEGAGFFQALGWPVSSPIPGKAEIEGRATKFNQFGDLIQQIDAGVPTEFSNFDDLSRPGMVSTLDGVTSQLDYTYENGLYKVTQTDDLTGATSINLYSSRGNLIQTEQAFGSASLITRYTYDDLGRLLTVAQDDGTGSFVTRYAATYDVGNLSHQPNSETRDAETHTFTLVDGFQPTITGLTRTFDGNPRAVNFASDSLGRAVISEMAGQGIVQMQYDAFDRITTVQPLVQGKTTGSGINYTYGPKIMRIEDHFRGINSTITTLDDAGLEYHVVQDGPGLDNPIERTYRTSIEEVSDKLGYRFTHAETGGPVEQATITSATGQLLGVTAGDRSWQAVLGQRNRFGQPTEIEGAIEGTLNYDSLGRLASVIDEDELTQSFSYDHLFRLAGGTDKRGKQHAINYFGVTGDVAGNQITGPNVDGTPTLPALTRTNRTSGTSKTWQGRERQVLLQTLDTQVDVTRTLPDSTTATASLFQDPTSGLLEKITNFSGDETLFAWANSGRDLQMTLPNGETRDLRFDAFGQLRSLVVNGVPKLTLERDDAQRITDITTETRTLNYHYQGQDLMSVTGGRYPVTFQGHNEKGLPGEVQVGDVADLSLTYHPGGKPKTLVSSRRGGLATKIETEPQGAITMIQRGHEAAVSYTSNPWGAPATMQLQGGPVLELYSGDLQTLNLPAGVIAKMDDEGRLAEIQRPGLAPKTFEYDESDRLLETLIGGVSQKSFAYTEGELTSVTTGSGAYTDLRTYTHDGFGRLTQVDSTLDGTSTMAYVLADNQAPQASQRHSDRLKSYTDANGVTQHYQYSLEGYLTHIDIENGPTFLYNYDPAGNLLSVAVDAMAANYANYDQGLPSDISWVYEGQVEQTFTLTRTPKGRLRTIQNGEFRLELEWSLEPETGEFPQPVIEKLTKKGPGLKEIWVPVYDADQRLISVTITRVSGSDVDADPCGTCQTQVIEETYGSVKQLLTGLERLVDGVEVLNTNHVLDAGADQRRISERTEDGVTLGMTYDNLGSLTAMAFSNTVSQAFELDGQRKVRQIQTTTANGVQTETYQYDPQNRRISRSGSSGKRIYAHHDSRVIAIGTQATDGTVQWTHAIGHGPLGPVFVRDLTGNGMDRFIWTDHLGTPFAWHDPATDATTYTPYNPWGELLATQPPVGPPWASEGEVATVGFTLATDAVFPLPPLGLAGHLYDVETGLVQMHHRYYSPRLGHFLTPDYRAPDIYDPSTFTEPYAYAAGNPMMFLDPDGLHEDYGWYVNQPEDSPAEAFGALEALAWQGVEIKPEVRAILDESSVKANEFTAGNIQAAAEIAKETAVGLGQLAYIGGGTMLGIQDAQKRGQDLVWSVVTLEAFNQLGEQWARNIMLAEQASKNGDWALASRLLSKTNTEMVSFGGGMLGAAGATRSLAARPGLRKKSIFTQSISQKLYYGLKMNRFGPRRSFYHGTTSPKSDFARIDPNIGEGQLGAGFYGTDDISTALWYAHENPTGVLKVNISQRDFKKFNILTIEKGSRLERELSHAFKKGLPIPDDIAKTLNGYDAIVAPLRVGPDLSSQIKFSPSVVHKLWVE